MEENKKSTADFSRDQEINEQYDRNLLERFTMLKAQRVLDKTVGEITDFVPFAWRNPIDLSGQKKVGRVLRNMVTAESARRDLVPAEKKFE